MGDGYATQDEIKHWLQSGPFRGRNWDQACQAFVYQICAAFGHAQSTYLSANRAYRASKIVSMDPKKAGADAVHYWSIGTFGHVAKGIKGSLVLMASKHVRTKWATNVGTITVEEYTRLTGARYLGWSHSNGVNKLTIGAKPAPPKPKPKPLLADQRKAASVVNARQFASSTSKIIGKLEKGHVGNFKGYVRGEKIDGNNIWFQGDSGPFYWSGGFENRSTTGLKDLTPLTPHQRKIDSTGAYVWETPFAGASKVDTLKPDSVVTIISYTKDGREHDKVTLWFQIGAKAWIWAGDTLDPHTHDLVQSKIKND